MTLCECGCGEEVKEGRRYVRHHHLKGKKLSKEHKEKISKSLEGNQFAKGFKHTKETRKKVSIAGLGKKRSKETCSKLSEVAKNRKYSAETREKLSKVAKKRIFSLETREKIGLAAKGREKTLEEREKLSIANKGQIPSAKVGRGKRSFYDSPYQGKVCFRSSYERAYAIWLDKNDIDWLYECKTFDLGETTYLPDFYLIKSRGFIEIKGYMHEKAQEKIDIFRKYYSNEKLDVLFKEDLIWLGVEI